MIYLLLKKRLKNCLHISIYKRFSTLMKEQCLKHGIGLGWVNPAYTSKLRAMLQNRMKLNIHNLAAFVIARRYMGFDKYKFKKKGI